MSGSAEVLNKKKVKVLEKNYCPKQDSNAGPCDLQSSALPSELQICWQKLFNFTLPIYTYADQCALKLWSDPDNSLY